MLTPDPTCSACGQRFGPTEDPRSGRHEACIPSCSQCGAEFPDRTGDGYSHCDQHAGGRLTRQLPFEEYQTRPGWRSSDLRAWRTGPPALVPWNRAHPVEQTAAMRLGSAVHLALLEPELWESTYVVRPPGLDGRTKDGKAWLAEQSRSILTTAEGEAVTRTVAALRTVPEVGLLLAGDREISLEWTDPTTGATCKARPDILSGGVLADLKVSCHGGSPRIVARSIEAGWWHQLAWYRRGLEAVDETVRASRLIVVDPRLPELRLSLVEIDPNALDLLDLGNSEALGGIAACSAAGVWPGVPSTWQRASLPPWYTSANFELTEEGEANGETE